MENFIWGIATASYQIEGATNVNKEENIWDHYCHTTSNIKDRTSGDMACDFYHKYPEDIKLAKECGFKYFRLSISWSRIIKFPENVPNEEGIKFYRNVLKTIRDNGMKACVTLYHWDLPQFLQSKPLKGWASSEIIQYFTTYTNLCFKEFQHLVDLWITFNEPRVFALKGYQSGITAPGLKGYAKEAIYNVLISHAKTVKLFRDKYNGKNIGITLNTRSFVPVHPDSSEEQNKCHQIMDETIGTWAHPVMFGSFPDTFTANYLPKLSEDDKQLLKSTVDFIGINYYTTTGIVYENGKFGPKELGIKSAAKWLRSYPDGLIPLLEFMKMRYDIPIIITENGYCTPDDIGINDAERVKYYDQHLEKVQNARKMGLLKGYFAWTLMDNFEWNAGYTERFGIIYIDFTDPTLKREKKKSYYWWQEFLSKENTL